MEQWEHSVIILTHHKIRHIRNVARKQTTVCLDVKAAVACIYLVVWQEAVRCTQGWRRYSPANYGVQSQACLVLTLPAITLIQKYLVDVFVHSCSEIAPAVIPTR
jgi:hypothetical protein